jgi:hypothetical protein
MIRFDNRSVLFAVLAALAGAAPAFAQLPVRPTALPVAHIASAVQGELHGVINDERGEPLGGAVVSALGATSAFAVSDRDGRFAFRNLPVGPYLVRAHLQGYLPARGRVMQVQPGARSVSTIALTRRTDTEDAPQVLEAGVGATSPVAAEPDAEEHGHDEIAWRLRHVKRSVLKEAEHAIASLGDDGSFMGDSLSGLGRAVGSPARLATAFFADLPLTGQFNLLTTTSFDRPQDLFAMTAGAPRGVAYVSLVAPGSQGDWTMRGTITQGDVASWILAGSYVRRGPETHQYQAGVSYSTQRYLGGNGEALAAIREGSRNVGSMYAYDDWAVASRVRVGYGAKYASHDYLEDSGLWSPRASVTVQPVRGDSFRVRTSVSHRETAPGAEEFLPPAVGLSLPPERTFSHVSRDAFRPQRLDHVEVAAEREWAGDVIVGVRTFTQRVQDQVVTLFGVAVAEVPTPIGHYQVGSAGNFEAHGWGLSVSRAMSDGIRASVDYTLVDSEWLVRSPDAAALEDAAGTALGTNQRIHDVTASVESVVAPTATRIFAVYKMNTAFAPDAAALTNARFNVQVNQSLPFLNFTNAQWEMLVAVSNLFREDVVDGSVYDELLVVRPPKRVLGGVTVKF